MISIERLFSLISPKAISLEPVAGRGVFSKEDAAGVIAQAQAKCAVGVKVLEGSIAGLPSSRAELRVAITEKLVNDGDKPEIARALARMAVHEVCGSRICPKCHGTGETSNHGKQYECRVCGGIGRIVYTEAQLAHVFSELAGAKVSPQLWRSSFYDEYMGLVDELHRAAGDAEIECKRILRLVAEQQGGAV